MALFLVTVFLPLLAGALIYILGHKADYNFMVWLGIKSKYHVSFPDWMVFNLPDGLWFYALCNFLALVWANDARHYLWWVMPCFVLAILSEFGQKYRVIEGTFDTADILAYTLALLVFFITNKTPVFNVFKKKTYEKKIN